MTMIKKLFIIAAALAIFSSSINLAFTEEYAQDYTDKNEEYTHDYRKNGHIIVGIASGRLTKDFLDNSYKYHGGLEELNYQISFWKQDHPPYVKTLQIRCLKYVGMIGSAVILPIILMPHLKEYIQSYYLSKEEPLETLAEPIKSHTDYTLPEYV